MKSANTEYYKKKAQKEKKVIDNINPHLFSAC